MTKGTTTHRGTEVAEGAGLLQVRAGSAPPVDLHEASLVYDGLGPALQVSRAANFVRLIEILRQRCPAAAHDERLNTRAFQAQVLGPGLSPEENFDVALALLVRARRNQWL
jgi:hypothetical protein